MLGKGNDLDKGSIGGEEPGYKGPGSQTTEVELLLEANVYTAKEGKSEKKKILIRNEDA